MITNDELRLVSTLAEKQVILEASVKATEESLTELKQELRLLAQETLPNAMAECGMSAFTLVNGRKITIKTNYYAALPKGQEGEAFDWLRGHGFGALIKNQVIAEFGKGEDERAQEVIELLREDGIYPEQKMGVHAQTLKAFVKEQISSGRELPLELFGAFVLNESVIT